LPLSKENNSVSEEILRGGGPKMKNFHSPFKQFAVYFDHILGAKNRVVERVPLGIPNSEFS